MPAEIQTALSLKDIIKLELPEGRGLFRLPSRWLRDFIVCLVGDRGSGKSLGGGLIALLDHMLYGFPCFSNMDIHADFEIDEITASYYGLQEGHEIFESIPLDKYKFLHFDKEYRNGVFFTHEFNIWLADARRSQSNLNLETDDVSQQLRKLNASWILDCLHEMFVDIRIRDFVDLYIKTEDVAFTTEGMMRKLSQGVEFDWSLYPMSKKAAALLHTQPYDNLKGSPIGPYRWHGQRCWGLIDTGKRAEREKYKKQVEGVTKPEASLEVAEPPELTVARSRYGWLFEAIKKLHDEGYEKIHNEEMWDYLRIDERGLSREKAGKLLHQMNIRTKHAPRALGGFYYVIDTLDLERGVLPEKKEAVLVRGGGGL